MRVVSSPSQLAFVSVIFLLSEWLLAVQAHAQSYNGRRHLKSSFTSILNQKLLDSGIFCVLKKQFNWFKNQSGLKRNASYWSGKYLCINCQTKFAAKIDADPEQSRAQSSVKLRLVYNKVSSCTEKQCSMLILHFITILQILNLLHKMCKYIFKILKVNHVQELTEEIYPSALVPMECPIPSTRI